MRLLDEEPAVLESGWDKPNTPHNLVNRADDNIHAGGITGYMAGAVASMVSACHSRGEEFKRAWNAKYLREGEEDKAGVVNPALITINMGGKKNVE